MSTDTTPKHASLVEALAAAQGEFGPIGRNRVGQEGNRKFKYVDLSSILAAVAPALSRHGIAHTTRFDTDPSGATVLVSELHHGAETLASRLPVAVTGVSIMQAGKNITYLRRYALQALLDVCPDDEDQDGDDLGDARQPPARQQGGREHRSQQPPVDRLPGVPPPQREARSQEAVTIDEARIGRCRRVVEKELAAGSWAYADPAAGTLSQPFASADEACRDLIDVMAESPPGWVAAAMRANEPLINAAGDTVAREMASLHMRKNGGASASEGAPQ